VRLSTLRDSVLVERDEQQATESGIALLDSHKDPAGTETGRVVSLKKSYQNMETGVWFYTQVMVGDRVLFARKHGIAVKGSKTQVVVKYENLLAVFVE